MTNNQTPEQHMADIASAALRNTSDAIRLNLVLISQVIRLVDQMDETDRESDLPRVLQELVAGQSVLRDAQESIRGLCSTLPIRGLDYA